MTPTPPRRSWRPRFGLRSLFVVVVIVAIPCAWVGYSLNWIRERHEMLNAGRVVVPNGCRNNLPANTAYSLRLFGERGHPALRVADGSELDVANRLFPEADIEVGSPVRVIGVPQTTPNPN